MIEKANANFRGSIDVRRGVLVIIGLRSGWRHEILERNLARAADFYRGLSRKREKAIRRSEGVCSNHYKDTLEIIQWAERILSDE